MTFLSQAQNLNPLKATMGYMLVLQKANTDLKLTIEAPMR